MGANQQFRDDDFDDKEFIAQCRAYIAEVEARGATTIHRRTVPLAPYQRAPLRMPPVAPKHASDRAREVAALAMETFRGALKGLTYDERWRATFAHFGLAPTDPDAVAQLMSHMAFALGEARHPNKDEPALPFFVIPLSTAERYDKGKTKASEHWWADELIEDAMARGLSQAKACEEVFATMKADGLLPKVKSAKSLEKAYIRREKERAGCARKMPGSIVAGWNARAGFEAARKALVGLIRPRRVGAVPSGQNLARIDPDVVEFTRNVAEQNERARAQEAVTKIE